MIGAKLDKLSCEINFRNAPWIKNSKTRRFWFSDIFRRTAQKPIGSESTHDWPRVTTGDLEWDYTKKMTVVDEWMNVFIYYMEESVLLGTKPLVDSMRHFIRDPNGVFSVCHLCECRIVQWRHDSRLLLLLNWFLHIIKRTLHVSSKIWILCSRDKNNISRVSAANEWDIVLATRTKNSYLLATV